MAHDLESIILELNDVFPDHYLSTSLAEAREEGVADLRPKRAVADCIVRIATDLYDADSALTANLRRIENALEVAQMHLGEVQQELRRIRRAATGDGSPRG